MCIVSPLLMMESEFGSVRFTVPTVEAADFMAIW